MTTADILRRFRDNAVENIRRNMASYVNKFGGNMSRTGRAGRSLDNSVSTDRMVSIRGVDYFKQIQEGRGPTPGHPPPSGFFDSLREWVRRTFANLTDKEQKSRTFAIWKSIHGGVMKRGEYWPGGWETNPTIQKSEIVSRGIEDARKEALKDLRVFYQQAVEESILNAFPAGIKKIR